MRVVMISKALVVGAYQRKLKELAKLPDLELTAIVPPAWHDRRGNVALERNHHSGYTLEVAPLFLNGQYHLHFYPTIGRILSRLRPDILHMDEEPYNLATWHCIRSARVVGARSLFFTWQNLRQDYPWPFSYFEQSDYRQAAYAIAGNQDALKVLRTKGYTGPATVIPQFGVDPELFSPHPDRVRSAQGFVIGYAGGLIAEKGVDVLLRACGGAAHEAGLAGSDWSLAILGDGSDRPRLERLAQELGIGQRVRFLGRRPSAETPAFYRQIDVLVVPSVSRSNWVEQFGRVLIEAMACGVPVIGSTCGELPQVIGEAGIVVPEGDSAALWMAIARVAGEPGLGAHLAKLGRERVLAQFTQAQVAAATYAVYRSMLGQRGQLPE